MQNNKGLINLWDKILRRKYLMVYHRKGQLQEIVKEEDKMLCSNNLSRLRCYQRILHHSINSESWPINTFQELLNLINFFRQISNIKSPTTFLKVLILLWLRIFNRIKCFQKLQMKDKEKLVYHYNVSINKF